MKTILVNPWVSCSEGMTWIFLLYSLELVLGDLVVTKIFLFIYTEELLFNLFSVILDLFSITVWIQSGSSDLNNQ